MGHRNDDQLAKTGGGQINDGYWAWLPGTVSPQINDAQRESLQSAGEAWSHWNGMFLAWLGRAPRSFVGALPDRAKAFWEAPAVPPATGSFGNSFNGSFD